MEANVSFGATKCRHSAALVTLVTFYGCLNYTDLYWSHVHCPLYLFRVSFSSKSPESLQINLTSENVSCFEWNVVIFKYYQFEFNLLQ